MPLVSGLAPRDDLVSPTLVSFCRFLKALIRQLASIAVPKMGVYWALDDNLNSEACSPNWGSVGFGFRSRARV